MNAQTEKIEQKLNKVLDVRGSLYKIQDTNNKVRFTIRYYAQEITLETMLEIQKKLKKVKIIKKDLYDGEETFIFGTFKIDKISFDGSDLHIYLTFPKTFVYIEHNYTEMWNIIDQTDDLILQVSLLRDYLRTKNPDLDINKKQVKDYLLNFLLKEDD